MEFDNFTERARGFIQSAQTLALRSNHQQLTPLHLLKCLLEDTDGLAAKLINAAGGDAKQALINTEAELKKLPKVEGTGTPQTHLAPETARLFEQAEEIAKKSGDSFVTSEKLLLAITMAAGTPAAKAVTDAGMTAEALNKAIRAMKAEKKSVLIMAHRPAAIEECDTLLVLDGGTRRAFGPRDSVMKEVLQNYRQVVQNAGPGGTV